MNKVKSPAPSLGLQAVSHAASGANLLWDIRKSRLPFFRHIPNIELDGRAQAAWMPYFGKHASLLTLSVFPFTRS